jgi:hypothetical protein
VNGARTITWLTFLLMSFVTLAHAGESRKVYDAIGRSTLMTMVDSESK